MWSAADFQTLDGLHGALPSIGTRFRLFPQAPYVSGYSTPETIWISTPPDRIAAGPEDHRSYVRDPVFPKDPYEYPYLPPFVGESFAPAEADFEGHFDTIPLNARQFLAAHAFASVSRVMDIWESYLGRPIVWHFADTYERLEIIPYVEWDNAQSGFGYLELGMSPGDDGRRHPYALNFDVIAHEVGHSVLFSLIGFPDPDVPLGDYAPFHEANADLISLLSFLHFDSGLDRLLRHTQGNLIVLNELNRIAELAGDRQIRLASNARKLSETTFEVHDRSRPLTGAIFDTIVDAYHMRLVAEGLADERLLGFGVQPIDERTVTRLSGLIAQAYRASPFRFKSALAAARDDVAMTLASTWPRLDPNDLDFGIVARVMVEAAADRNRQLAAKFEENFRWREIL